ncbi:GNAT family N-acetyltransferase [Georgenia halophila]|uniref:GNAT family N-acetyltransferase n=1 Tax=Georgenia halophila TaxID=620889 RepID=A0ABP8KYZ5_9MICO
MDTSIRTREDRFEILLDGEAVGLTQFVDEGERRHFFHTVVADHLQGRGLAADLVGHALDETRRAGQQVVPTCSYVARYIDEHPQYADLVAGGAQEPGA